MTKKRKKKYKSVITKRIFQSLRKVGVCFLLLTFLSSVVAMRGTNAGFLDQESSENNTMASSTLDFSVSSSADFSPKVSPSMETTRTISISNEGLENFQYRISASNFSGDTTGLCDKLEIKDDLDDTFQNLKTYLSSTTNNSIRTDWDFTIQLIDNDDALADKTCNFDLVIESWQTGLLYGAGGFVDTETISNTVESEHWTNIADHLVINEVYYDADGTHGSEPDNEWVEIYNPTSSAVNLKDWEICDNMGCVDLATADLDILANGYAVVTKEASTWGFWTVPGSAIKIVLGTTIGNGGLSNTGDRLILRNNSGLEIDAMSYGTDITRLNPACPDVSAGHSLARKPAGQDLNVNSDFEDLVSPNPGTNPHTVVMNEIMPNPFGDDEAEMPDGEWIELYNYGEYDINLENWKLEDGDGDKLSITEDNTDTDSTTIKAGEKLVVYRNNDNDFDLNDDGDTVSLIDEKDLIKDSYEFEETPEGKTIARFPDAVGPWVDPEGTPGEKNVLSNEEINEFRLYTFEKCFISGELDNESGDQLCDVYFLKYLGMIDKIDSDKLNEKLELEILDLKLQKEEEKLLALLKESEEILTGQQIKDDNGILIEEDAEIIEEPKVETETETDETETVEAEILPSSIPIENPEVTPIPDLSPTPTSEISSTPTTEPIETPEITETSELIKEPEPVETPKPEDEPAPAEVTSQE